MDVFLGMNIQIIFSLVTLAVSLLWCKVMMHCFTKNEKSLINTNDKKQEDGIILVWAKKGVYQTPSSPFISFSDFNLCDAYLF